MLRWLGLEKCNSSHVTRILKRAIAFIKVGILPELTGKWYSREPSTVSTITMYYSVVTADDESEDQEQGEWCYCRKANTGDMICCDSKDCPIQSILLA